MRNQDFEKWFAHITHHDAPYPWQSNLAADQTCRSRLIRIPTGLGKTQGVLAAWSYHRLCRGDDKWPRRLVWCLPMRVLVEQTEQVARQLADRLPQSKRPAVHIAMGGENSGEWFLYPERPAILIGTQDMLLSRALNRGYASPRARWPMEFGLLNQDALWVMDEVQLMDVGLATSAQLQAFRDEDSSKHLRPCFTWWMSATLQPEWLRSIDTKSSHDLWVRDPCEVPAEECSGRLWDASKSVGTAAIQPDDDIGFAARILEEHGKLSDGPFGKITLVVCNTVERACQTFDTIAKRHSGEVRLIHSRFRLAERETWLQEFLDKRHCKSGVDRIIIATQVVEAGVDISAGCLITELAPWPSLVQRFGRCARYGGSGRVLVVDRRKSDDDAAPYRPEELKSALATIQDLKDVGIKALQEHEASLSPQARQQLYPYSPSHLLLRQEFDELFDTTPDLTGADLDISRFIRSGEERDLQVFWLEVPLDGKGEKPHRPPENYKPHQREFCAIPFRKARDWLCDKGKSSLKTSKRAWVWDYLDGEWKTATRESMLPGRILCVAADSGGYTPERGFDARSTGPVTLVSRSSVPSEVAALEEADDHQDGESLSCGAWKTIACHSQEVAEQARELARELKLEEKLQDLLGLAALWHDWGKVHPAFQGAIQGASRPPRDDLAKAPVPAWRRPPNMYRDRDGSDTRPAFRHELASALGLFALLALYKPDHDALLGPWVEVLDQLKQLLPKRAPLAPPTPLVERLLKCSAEDFDLVAYLVASHHGKVRVGLHATPNDQEYRDRDGRGLPIRGIREGDQLPSVELVAGEPCLPEVKLTLEPAKLGLSPITGISWRERCIGLQERFGPAALAFLEAILRAADVRASRLTTIDPALAAEDFL